MSEVQGASVAAIRHHYDISNAFYALWLDSSMTYTCAFFNGTDDDASLERAQERKIDYILGEVDVKPGARVLDIGCGWGALLKRCANYCDAAQAVGLSLSEAQTEWALADGDPRVAVRLESWTDHQADILYDAIVSVEAIEAFASPGMNSGQRMHVYRQFFERCHSWLRPGGRLYMQAIAYGNSGPEDLDPFISSEIFPESDLPSLTELSSATQRLFEFRRLVNDREHYVKTLRAWLARLREHRDEAVSIVGEECTERYERYLRLCIYIFASGSCDLYRITLKRIDFPRPRSRA